MICSKKYPKTFADYEKWFIINYELHFLKVGQTRTGEFYKLPEEMQVGVYLKYFDQYKLVIDLQYGLNGKTYQSQLSNIWGFEPTVCDNKGKKRHNLRVFKTRMEALKSAISQASEIREKEL